MRRLYVYEKPDWPRFRWDTDRLAHKLADVRFRQGRLAGRMHAVGFDLRREAVHEALTQDAHKTSDIEGERLDLSQVRSSVARRLGIDAGGLAHVDEAVEGVVEMTLDATRNYELPLTPERLWGWQAALIPSGRSRFRQIIVGGWRDDSTGPMQVVSGPIGRERVHFEAPRAERIEDEMGAFLDWFNSADQNDGVIRAGLAHLWFVTIHPFDDGNGRVARAITDMALARSEGSADRFYSMSAQIRAERSGYYRALERSQRGTTDVTEWLGWFLGCLDRAIDGAETLIESVLNEARFWEGVRDISLNHRQRRVLNRLLDGFEGKLTSSKWAKLAKCSQDTALRDITALVGHGVLVRSTAGGRSTSYHLAPVSHQVHD